MAQKVISSSVWLMILLVLGLIVSPSVGEIPCNQAIALLGPCQGFLTGRGNAPPLSCCRGVATINSKAATTANRKTLCVCFKQAAVVLRVKPDRVFVLSKACNVNVKVPISVDVDCAKIPENINGDQEEKWMIHN